MNALLIALLFQSFAMLPRTAVENPAVVAPLPKKLQKDYDKIWSRFVKGKEDPKVLKDAGKILAKNPDQVALIIVEAYVDLYKNQTDVAEKKLEGVLTHQPDNRIALAYLADLTFARQDYARAGDLYRRLLEADPRRTDVEPKRQKALLLATDNLLRAAAKAEQENRISEAESLYLRALQIAPQEPSLHDRLAQLYARDKKWEQALAEFTKLRELGGSADESDRSFAETLANLGRTEEAREVLDRLRQSGSGDDALEAKVKELEDLGRWGKDIGLFHQIEAAPELRREELAALMVRYFPQMTEFRRVSQVVTDIQGSWARPEIQTVTGVGVLDPLPNHTFQPAASVSRIDLAVALARLSRILQISLPATAPVPTTDVGSRNALYREIQFVVSYGLMGLDASGRFNLNGKVSGAEGVRAMERLLELQRPGFQQR